MKVHIYFFYLSPPKLIKRLIYAFCLAFCCLFFPLSGLKAQNTSDDLLAKARTYQQKKDFTASLDYYLKALQVCEKEHNQQKLSSINYEIGLLYEQTGVDQKALEYFLRTYKHNQNIEITNKTGAAYIRLNKPDDALFFYKKALNFYQKQNNTEGQINCLKSIVGIHKIRKEFGKSLEYSLKIHSIQKKNGNKKGIAEAVNSIGYFYKFLNDPTQSLIYFDEALHLYKELGDVENTCAVFTNQGVTYRLLGNNKKSLSSFLAAVKIRQNQKKNLEVAKLYNYISAVYLIMHDDHNAQIYANRAIQLGEKVKSKQTLATSYETLSIFYQKKGYNKKALKYYKLHVQAKDSLLAEYRQKQEALQKKQVEAENKERELRLLLAGKERQTFALEKIRLEADKKDKENELLKKTQALQKANLQQQALERQKAEQSLLLTRQQLGKEKQAREIALLQQQDKLQKLAIRQKESKEKEIKKENELLSKSKALQELKLLSEKEKLQNEQHKRKTQETFYIGIGVLLAIIILLVLVSFIMARRANQKLANKNKEIKNKNSLLEISQEEIIAQNKELQAMQTTKDLMISAVNHDLRNPLNPILNYSHENYPRFNEKERLNFIHERAGTMLTLIDNIMDVYRADKLVINPTPSNLHQVTDQAILIISETGSNLPQIINEVSPPSLALFDYQYIRRVLENLLSNAVKYTAGEKQGGWVKIKSELNESGNKLKLLVQDNGMGIPKDRLENIFLPFVNPEARDLGVAKSVGIGLTFCKTVIEAHRSIINVTSQEGKGTTFWFELPTAKNRKTNDDKSQNFIDIYNLSICWSKSEKTQLTKMEAEIRTHKFRSAQMRRCLQQLEAGDSENLQQWKTALLQAKEQRDEKGFDFLLGLIN